jgi:hypothetical protein
MKYSAMIVAGLYPLAALCILLVIFGIMLMATLGTLWAKRRFYSERLDDETVERLKNLKDDGQP